MICNGVRYERVVLDSWWNDNVFMRVIKRYIFVIICFLRGCHVKDRERERGSDFFVCF